MTRLAELLSGVQKIRIQYTVRVRIRSVTCTYTEADTMDGYRMMLPSTATTPKPSPSPTMLTSLVTLGTATITAVRVLWNLQETWAGVCFLSVPLCCIQLLDCFVVSLWASWVVVSVWAFCSQMTLIKSPIGPWISESGWTLLLG